LHKVTIYGILEIYYQVYQGLKTSRQVFWDRMELSVAHQEQD